MSYLSTIVNNDLGPLFRLLDNYEVHRSSHGARAPSSIRAFQPKFDVRESKDAYELYGEICGVEQDDISVDFTDPHTIVIRGRVERNSGTRTTEEAKEAKGGDNDSYHKPTVEDDVAAENAGTSALAKADTQSGTNGIKYWVTERSVGEFHRSFSFPSPVDQNAVKASLKNGILNIVIPKMQAPQTRRIQIS